MDHNRIIDLARECIGTPFYHQGRVLGVGMDCAGVVAHILEGLNLPYNDARGYPRTPFDGMLKKCLDEEPSLMEVGALEPACVVLMRVTNDPQHLAIWTGEKIIHSSLEAGKATEEGMPSSRKAKIVACYRIVK